jgi:hypothetical protein
MDALFPSIIDGFRQTVDRAAARLLKYSDPDAARRPAPGKWSRKEIIGHLIDSACNNHGRFVRADLRRSQVRFANDYGSTRQPRHPGANSWARIPLTCRTRARTFCASCLDRATDGDPT